MNPYMLGGLSAADYKKKAKDFFGEDARILRKLATKEACELILDNIPKEEEPEGKLDEVKIYIERERERGI